MQWQTTLPSLVRTMVTVDPKLSYIVPSVDAMVPSVKPAVIAVGAGDKIKIVSNNASLPDMQAIATKTDQEVADIGASNERMGWATVDQIARRLGVHASTVEGWRQDALGGVEQALRRGSGKTATELELERKTRDLEKVVTTLSIQKCLLENALETERAKRPTGPARSRR